MKLPPNIDALPKTRTGLPVPHVAAWSSERTMRIANDPNIGGNHPTLFSNGAQGEGEPVLGQMDVARQRTVVVHGRCQVCNVKLPARDRFVVTLWEKLPDGTRLVREPWACTTCLAFALRVCPGLLGARRTAGLDVVRMTHWTTPLALTSVAGLVADGLLDPSPDYPELVYGYAKIIPGPKSITLGVDAFLRSFGGR